MSEIYEPNSQFLDRLEWQLSTEYRRKMRLRSIPGKITVSRRLAAIAMILGALTAGVSVLKATEYFKDSWRKKIEIARIRTDVELKKVQLESTIEIVTQAEMWYSKGLIEEEEYRVLEHAVTKAELYLQESLINLDEVITSGDAPQDQLYAPVLGGRDFVSERLQIKRQEAELNLVMLRSPFERFKQWEDLGLVHGEHLDQIKAEMAAQEAKIEKIQKDLEQRHRFITGEVTAQEVEIEGRISDAKRTLQLAESKVDLMQSQLTRLKNLKDRGMISPMEITQMEYALNAARAELQLAVLEMDVLREIR